MQNRKVLRRFSFSFHTFLFFCFYFPIIFLSSPLLRVMWMRESRAHKPAAKWVKEKREKFEEKISFYWGKWQKGAFCLRQRCWGWFYEGVKFCLGMMARFVGDIRERRKWKDWKDAKNWKLKKKLRRFFPIFSSLFFSPRHRRVSGKVADAHDRQINVDGISFSQLGFLLHLLGVFKVIAFVNALDNKKWGKKSL